MSKHSIDVLNRWVAEFVRPVPAEAAEREAERLTTEFSAYAADAGINLERLEEEIGADIVSHMREALMAVSDGGDEP